ncbi:hypothetical protein QP794_25655 [Paenibacillus sp. UMB7766-LJ446]|uniref:hypothetical protein n=1 Tax=Paenibacillus sp. UMB7766-LJ446 TaxID=3046313 RepID=UPI0025510875|nr:hypothetical protein [Paenibacillus sp. UMB7766-LJ446]MDK8193481.1 hypothetical protein [Paenibacillus sp. UMB7766-LJ446]
MYFNAYENFISRLSEFRGGRYYVDLITSMIPQGDEGSFVSSERHDIEPIRFVIVNAEKFITGSVDWLGEEKLEVSFTSYNKKDITSINVLLLNPSSMYYENTDFKQMQVNITFHNGTEINLNKQDYFPEGRAFTEVVKLLVK